MADVPNKAFVVTRTYVVKVPESHLAKLEADYPDTSVEGDLIDAATRCADVGNNKGNMYLYRNEEGDLYWLDEPYDLTTPNLAVVEYDADEVDYDYEESYKEVNYTCGQCQTGNTIVEGSDPGEYRCTKCASWL